MGPNFGLAAFLERMTWNGKTILIPPKSRMEPCESKTLLYLFSHPPTLDLEEAGGDGRAGRNFPSTIKPVLSGHPGEWRTDCLIQVDLLIKVWQTWENIQEK